MEELDELRQKINEIDRELVALYTKRLEVCREVGLYKKAHHLPVLDAAREKQVLRSKSRAGAAAGITVLCDCAV